MTKDEEIAALKAERDALILAVNIATEHIKSDAGFVRGLEWALNNCAGLTCSDIDDLTAKIDKANEASRTKAGK